MANYGSYKELRENALKPTATQEDINALGEWFSQYGNMYWNGEYYDISDKEAKSGEYGFRLYPVYKEVDEDEYELIGWEIR